MKLFTDDEVKNEYNFSKNELPLISDILKYVVSRRDNKNHPAIVRALAHLVHGIWTNRMLIAALSVLERLYEWLMVR